MKKIESLYVHVPFCKHLCNYCDFYKKRWENDEQLDQFHQYLNQSYEVQLKLFQEHELLMTDLKTIYFGGGTPSLWGKKGAIFFQTLMKKYHLNLTPSYEWTMEVDPDAWDEESLSHWLNLGVNRVSVGSQSFSDSYLKILDRKHRTNETFALVDFLKKQKISFSLDLMLAGPELKNFEKRNLGEELDVLTSMNPQHVSIYLMETRKNYLHFSSLASDDRAADEYLLAAKKLKEAGFDHYEVSNFAKKGAKSQHNRQYWQMQNVAALGPTGTGYFKVPVGGFRYKWKVMSPQFEIEKLSLDELMIEKLYLSLRTSQSWTLEDIFREPEVQGPVRELLYGWVQEGLFESISSEEFRTTTKGFLVLDTLIQRMLSYL